MPEPNVYQHQQAMHLATHLHHQGVSADEVDTMSSDQLADHAVRAGLGRVPKGDSLEWVKQHMKGLATPVDDPFAGL